MSAVGFDGVRVKRGSRVWFDSGGSRLGARISDGRMNLARNEQHVMIGEPDVFVENCETGSIRLPRCCAISVRPERNLVVCRARLKRDVQVRRRPRKANLYIDVFGNFLRREIRRFGDAQSAGEIPLVAREPLSIPRDKRP